MKEKQVFDAPAPLGPGDSARKDPKTVHEAPRPLEPGDSAREKPPVNDAPRAALPGDGEGDEFEGVALPPWGPGDLQVPRPIVQRPRKRSQPTEE